jgi:hypothetical protein
VTVVSLCITTLHCWSMCMWRWSMYDDYYDHDVSGLLEED